MLCRIKLLILALGIVSCQSTQFVVPATEAYRTQVSPHQSVPISLIQPALTAALPREDASNEYDTRAKPLPELSGIVATTPQVLAPDTAVKQLATPVVGGKADPTTTVVNSIGAAITVVGVGVLIANSGEAPKTEWGGLTQTILVLGGIIMALFGLALLFFQGKNGRLRRLREARKAAASPTPGQSPTVITDPVKPSGQTSRKHTTGLRLMMVGGIIGLLGYLASGFFLLLLPVAVILLLVGAVVSITSH